MRFFASAARRPKPRAQSEPKPDKPDKTVAQGNPPPAKTPRTSRPRGASTRKAPPPPVFKLSPAQQEQVTALVLLVIAMLTFLGAVNPTNGSLLDGWTHVLSVVFGWGRYLAPFFFAGFGAWLMLDSLDMRPDIGWERPFALIILFIVLESFLQIVGVDFVKVAATSMDTAYKGGGGGLVGNVLYGVLVGGLGLAGALLVQVVLLAIGMLLLLNIPVSQIMSAISNAVQNVQALLFHRPSVTINRNGRERVPTEMMTAPPREKKNRDERGANEMPRLPADFGMDEGFGQEAPPALRASQNGTPVAARIVGGGGPRSR